MSNEIGSLPQQPVFNERIQMHTIDLNHLVLWFEQFEVYDNMVTFNGKEVPISPYNYTQRLVFLLTNAWADLGIYLLNVIIPNVVDNCDIDFLEELVKEIQINQNLLIAITIDKTIEDNMPASILDYVSTVRTRLPSYNKLFYFCNDYNLNDYVSSFYDGVENKVKKKYIIETSIAPACKELLKCLEEQISLIKGNYPNLFIKFTKVFINGVSRDFIVEMQTYLRKIDSEIILILVNDKQKKSNQAYAIFDNVISDANRADIINRLEQFSEVVHLDKIDSLIKVMKEYAEVLLQTNTADMRIIDSMISLYQKIIDNKREQLSGISINHSMTIYNKTSLYAEDESDLSEEYNDYLDYYEQMITFVFNDKVIEEITKKNNLLLECLVIKPLCFILCSNSRIRISIGMLYDNALSNTMRNLEKIDNFNGSSILYKELYRLTANSNPNKISNSFLAMGNINFNGSDVEYFGIATRNIPKLFAVSLNTLCDDSVYVTYTSDITQRDSLKEDINLHFKWSLKDHVLYKIDNFINFESLFDVGYGGSVVALKQTIKSIEVLPIYESLIYAYQKVFNNLEASLRNNTKLLKTYNSDKYESFLSEAIKDLRIDNSVHRIIAQRNMDNFIKCINAFFTQMGEDYGTYITLKDLCCFKVNYNDKSEVFIGYVKVDDTTKFVPINFDKSLYLNETTVQGVRSTSLIEDLYRLDNDQLYYAEEIEEAVVDTLNSICAVRNIYDERINDNVKQFKFNKDSDWLPYDLITDFIEVSDDPVIRNNYYHRQSNYKIDCLGVINALMHADKTFKCNDTYSYFLLSNEDIDNSIYDKFGDLTISLTKEEQTNIIDYLSYLISGGDNPLRHSLLVPLTINNTGTVMTPFGMRIVPVEDLLINANGLLVNADSKKFYAKMFSKKYRT